MTTAVSLLILLENCNRLGDCANKSFHFLIAMTFYYQSSVGMVVFFDAYRFINSVYQ